MSSLWLNDGGLVLDANGAVLCADCPCGETLIECADLGPWPCCWQAVVDGFMDETGLGGEDFTGYNGTHQLYVRPIVTSPPTPCDEVESSCGRNSLNFTRPLIIGTARSSAGPCTSRDCVFSLNLAAPFPGAQTTVELGLFCQSFPTNSGPLWSIAYGDFDHFGENTLSLIGTSNDYCPVVVPSQVTVSPNGSDCA